MDLKRVVAGYNSGCTTVLLSLGAAAVAIALQFACPTPGIARLAGYGLLSAFMVGWFILELGRRTARGSTDSRKCR